MTAILLIFVFRGGEAVYPTSVPMLDMKTCEAAAVKVIALGKSKGRLIEAVCVQNK